ncbi:hypothetical protein FHP29_05335 [Nocardioides albidus]|uniref:Serine acetyltransferase n=1 Tax=Nocardioides albidus TaxID=1517589 RepID=A0A5C4W9E7_9ACTN|nr:DapH/DapD/GlmU-related protein [Nocardioides albidus]TNM44135.1 hypothetical protein FHP29_05335 [Nocardioides albidus]
MSRAAAPGPTTDGAVTLGFSQLVFSDVAALRPGTRPGWLHVLLRLPFVPGALASIIVRAQQCLARSGRMRAAEGLRTLGNVLIGADFGAGMEIGPGLRLMHPVGVTMGYGARIGSNVTFAGGVVLAAKYYDDAHGREQEFPTIEDDVVLGANAVVVGGVTVGRNAMVGANSVVLSDVPPDTVVLGNPARRVAKRSPEGAAEA